jgi:hypothetical protein
LMPVPPISMPRIFMMYPSLMWSNSRAVPAERSCRASPGIDLSSERFSGEASSFSNCFLGKAAVPYSRFPNRRR